METSTSSALRRAEDLPDLLRRPEVAEFYGVAAQTLARWAVEHSGPKFIRIGSAVRYRKVDVLSFLEQKAS